MSVLLGLTRRALARRRPPGDPVAGTERAVGQPRPETPPPASLRRRHAVRAESAGGRAVLTVQPPGLAPGAPQVIYLHGGAFVAPANRGHWRLVAALLRRVPAAVSVPLYGLAPEHTVDDAFRLLDAVTARLAERAPAAPVVYAGDSAGATIALSYALRQRDNGAGRRAAALLLISPGVDLTMTNPAIAALEPRDVVLSRAQVRLTGQWWAGGRDLADPAVSPLRADLAGLPPVAAFAGDQEIFWPDVQRLHEKIRRAGGASTLTVARGGFHNYPFALWTREARLALDQAAAALHNLQ